MTPPPPGRVGATLTAVVTAHADATELERCLTGLALQARRADRIAVYASDIGGDVLGRLAPAARRAGLASEGALIAATPDMQDWGHSKRAIGLAEATTSHVAFVNADDEYDPAYFDTLMWALVAHQADVAFCDWNESPAADFRMFSSTAGNFIVKTSLGREVGGWPTERLEQPGFEPGYCNDGVFIERLKAAGARVVKAPRAPHGGVLYTHR